MAARAQRALRCGGVGACAAHSPEGAARRAGGVGERALRSNAVRVGGQNPSHVCCGFRAPRHLGCGCGDGPSARSLPAAAATWMVFGAIVAVARFSAAVVAATALRRRLRVAVRATPRVSRCASLAALVPAARSPEPRCSAGRRRPSAALPRAMRAGRGLLGIRRRAVRLRRGRSRRRVARPLHRWPPRPFFASRASSICARFAPAARRAAGRRVRLCGARGRAGRRRRAARRRAHSSGFVPATGVAAASRASARRQTPARTRSGAAFGAGTHARGRLRRGTAAAVSRDRNDVRRAFPGERLRFTGTLEREGSHSAVVRYAIACCRADALPVAVRLERTPPYDAGTWIRVNGRIDADLRLEPEEVSRSHRRPIRSSIVRRRTQTGCEVSTPTPSPSPPSRLQQLDTGCRSDPR